MQRKFSQRSDLLFAVLLLSFFVLGAYFANPPAYGRLDLRERFRELEFDKLRDDIDRLREEMIVIRKNRVEKLKVREERWSKVRDQIMRSGDVLKVEPNYLAYTQAATPNDEYFEHQWNMQMLKIDQVWDYSTGEDVVVAVVDSGVTQVEDLSQTEFVKGYDFVDRDNDPEDESGHGTHIAGTIAQSTNNNYGAVGIAYDAVIMPVRVLDQRGRGSYYDIYQGIIWAVNNGADVINLSLGGRFSSSLLERAVEYAYDREVVVIAAAGNNGDLSEGVLYPAAYDEYVLGIGAVRFDKKRVGYSSGGSALDFVAPGGDLSVDQNKDGYGDGILQETLDGFYFYQGTSMATAHMSGVAAALLSTNSYSVSELEEKLITRSKDLGDAGWDREYGHGLVDLLSLLKQQEKVGPTSTPVPPTATPTLTPIPTPTNTPTPTATSTPTPTPTTEPTATPVPTNTPTPQPEPTPTPLSSRWARICQRWSWLRICQ